MTNLNNFNNYSYQKTTPQQFLVQPQGMVYFINNSQELNNIPLSPTTGVSVAICIPEEMCYIKTLQNGLPMILNYKLVSQSQLQTQSSTQTEDQKEDKKDCYELFKQLDERLKKLEKSLGKGGKLDELI